MSKRTDTNKTSDIVIGAKVTKDEEARLIKFMKKHKLASKSEAIRKLITMTAVCMAMMISACGKSGGSSGGGAAPVNNLCAGPLNGTWNRQGFPGHYLTLNADCTGYDSNCGENFVSGLIQANSTVQITVAANAPGVCRTPGSTVTCNVAANGALTVIAINCGGGVETYYK